MPKTITLTIPAFRIRKLPTFVTTFLASGAAAACDWMLKHPAEVTAALARRGVVGVFAAVFLAGCIPSIAKKCHALAGDVPPDAAPASDAPADPGPRASPEAAAVNAVMTPPTPADPE